jgi:hypothetical protein
MIREEASEPFRAERVPIFHRLGLGLGLRSRRFGDSDWRGGWNGMTKTLNCADYDEDDPKRKSSRPSAEEGHRLVRLFLSVERADLREEIFNFVEEILRRQDRGQSVQRPRAASFSQIGLR